MLLLWLLNSGFVLADSGDTGLCCVSEVYVDADYINEKCVIADISQYCIDCPKWRHISTLQDWDLYTCKGEPLIAYAAYISYDMGGEQGGGKSLYFDDSGELVGVRESAPYPTWCCGGNVSSKLVYGNDECSELVPIVADSGGSDSGSGPESDLDSNSTPPPSSSCGCSGGGSGATAAVFGLLLLARRWFKR